MLRAAGTPRAKTPAQNPAGSFRPALSASQPFATVVACAPAVALTMNAAAANAATKLRMMCLS
jgi:hypothetical protein